MKLQGFKRLLKTDFKQDDQDLVDQLGNSLNTGIELLYQALNKRLTVSENLQATERDITLAVDASGKPRADTFATVDFGSQARNVFVGKADNLSFPGTYPLSAPFVSWTNTTSGIQVVNVTGLQPAHNYRIRLVIFG